MLTLLPGNCNVLQSACWPFLLVTALNLDGTASAQSFFLLMEDGNKVVLFYISNALIQDIPFWPLFVLATAAQQQEGKNGTTSVILFIFLQSGLLGRLGQLVEHGHMDIPTGLSMLSFCPLSMCTMLLFPNFSPAFSLSEIGCQGWFCKRHCPTLENWVSESILDNAALLQQYSQRVELLQ